MKLKHLAMSIALLAICLTFSSCLKDNDSSKKVGYDYVSIEGTLGSYVFTTSNGYKLIPSNQSIITKDLFTRYAFLQYGFTDEAWNAGQANKRIVVELYSITQIPEAELSGKASALVANAPTYSVGRTELQPLNISFFDNKRIMLPLVCFYKTSANEAEMNKERQAHLFYLYYDENDSHNTNTVLRLYLRHQVATPELNAERKTLGSYSVTSDITKALDFYKGKFGATPKKIEIEYEHAATGNYASLLSKEVSVDYKF